MNEYQENIIEHYRYPTHCSYLDNLTSKAKLTNSSCGDSIEIQVKVSDGLVTSAAFSGEGCSISFGGSDILCEYIIGKSVEVLKRFTIDDWKSLLGIKLTISREKCATLPYHALQKALEAIL